MNGPRDVKFVLGFMAWGKASKIEHDIEQPIGKVVSYWQGFRQKNIYGGDMGGDTNLLKRGICLLNTFLKDFTKMPIKKHTVLQFDGGGYPPLPKSWGGGDKSPPSPLWRRP